MEALPAAVRSSTDLLITGVTCPACPGTLAARALRPGGMLEFRCRIGHLFTDEELLTAKEDRLEAHLWGTVTVLEELVALLDDLGRHTDRRTRALSMVTVLRHLIQGDRPVTLADPTPEIFGDEPLR